MPYHPAMMSASPRNPQSWNRYAYTKGDPVNRVDPTGTDDTDGYDCTSWEYDASIAGNPCGSFTEDSSGGWPAPSWIQIFSTISAGIEADVQTYVQATNNAPVNCGFASSRYDYYCLTGGGPEVRQVQNDLQWLANNIDPDCASWLAAGKYNMPAFIQQQSVGVAGAFFYPGTLTPADSVPLTTNDVGFNIIANTASGFLQIPFSDQIFWLLHEISHLTGVSGSDTNLFGLSDGPANIAINTNVSENCQKTLKAATTAPN
jgi:hypothetical protein